MNIRWLTLLLVMGLAWGSLAPAATNAPAADLAAVARVNGLEFTESELEQLAKSVAQRREVWATLRDGPFRIRCPRRGCSIRARRVSGFRWRRMTSDGHRRRGHSARRIPMIWPFCR